MQSNSGKESHRLIILAILSVFLLVGGDYIVRFFQKDAIEPVAMEAEATAKQSMHAKVSAEKPLAKPIIPVKMALGEENRVSFETKTLRGSFNLKGLLLDDLTLLGYQANAGKAGELVRLLSPLNTTAGYGVLWNWHLLSPYAMMLPQEETVWNFAPLDSAKGTWRGVFTWCNPENITFKYMIFIDDAGMMHVKAQVHNGATQALNLQHTGSIRRVLPDTTGERFVHEGLVGYVNGALQEWSYEKLVEKKTFFKEQVAGWLGFTDKYWLVAFAPKENTCFKAYYDSDASRLRRNNQLSNNAMPLAIDISSATLYVPVGGTIEEHNRLFLGAKNLRILDGYESSEKIPHFDLAVDFGWFYFLTKPTFYVLSWLQKTFGSMALAILLFTVLLKLLFFPLANKSYRAMARMKELTPKMEALKARYKDDKQRMGQEVMALYKKEKVSPLSGCLPMLLNMPFFFALYKVLSVSIEMRHAPFWGWISDLSAPDPTNIFTLFGLIPWQTPDFLHLGIWPLLMGLTMYWQQRLSPPPGDPIQRNMFLYGMPVIFTFMLGGLSAGAVIFWTWQNILGTAQQWLLTRARKR